MQIRVFTAKDMNAGLRQVRKELGPDALILSTKTIKNGALGIFEKPNIEITAAIDSPYPEPVPRTTEPHAKPATPPASLLQKYDTDQQSETNEVNQAQHKNTATASPKTAFPAPQRHNGNDEQPLHAELKTLQHMVSNLAQRIETNAEQKKEHAHLLKEVLSPFFNSYGIRDKAATYLADRLLNDAKTFDSATLYQQTKNILAELISVAPPDFSQLTGQKRIALIGPTGVGKTTTLAKLAALFLSTQNNNIALITIDTYRIAAVEQLKVYGTIMQVPVEVVLSPEELRDALVRHSDKDLILIDTAGRSPKDSTAITELAEFLKPDPDIEKHLVLSAATREQELFDTITQFQPVGFERVLFTKVDECSTTGAIFSVHLENSTPLSFITNGQRVPEDLLIPTPRSITELILPPNRETTDDEQNHAPE